VLGSPYAKVDSITPTAARIDAAAKRWTVTCDFLCERLNRILGKATTAELIECLRVGQIINLPGTYTVYQLVQLGYRKTVVTAPPTILKSKTRQS
jgi:hypothetical protein